MSLCYSQPCVPVRYSILGHLKSSPHSSGGKSSAYNAGDPGLIPGLGRSPGEGNGNLPPVFLPENPMDRGAWQATAHGVTRVGSNLATKPPPPEGFCWVDKASHVKDNGYLQTGGYLGLEVST